ncbi:MULTISPECIES: thiamine pyrophosphate-binding protein [Caballeronia]|jgi:acetolactate synthase-1/2/3 large subunit|uniref:Thiamine pyrophosphate-binding protein n=1 Tax=Caballeronia zhejiangensis TaxID=871203 RepID=A0A656QIC2_9BURK|nr:MULTISPECIES: thiamine pyrophosphate-binding protein [Caballeronia]KDR29169.1 thiamine pyrophosphate-binding protein [Caballeronia zhejiangensis]MCG7405037.1 thiamine pyrophosphate-binding protein [Caballeronia zhejiangensis]MCI1041623.1 thiamine pyrophosphate-binding protein [Caballeronia zhejiangensis]MDR5763687.1 thiamine pyrophosphate-binding protein [Caballeronia sp. LZ028]MDR5786076.1 thiamine pyrophosphate-binding protein [Caballeronia sp. LP003]
MTSAVPSSQDQTTGARLLVDALVHHGVERVFCVPGESFLAVLDSLHDETEQIQTIVCRHEAGAANMAEAVGKLTGKPGVAIVTRGPGATHASIGVHTAFQDSTPMILLIGQCARDHMDREAFQEIDYRRMFGQMAKWVAQIDDPRRVPEYMSHAFHTAMSGRPGPVVLALPEDMLTETVDAVPPAPRYQRVAASPSKAQMERLRELLANAKKPFVIAGGSGWTAEATQDFARFVEAWKLPVGCAFRFQDTLSNDHPNYAGDVGLGINPALAARVRDADVLFVLGPRMGESTTGGYTLLDIPKTKQTLIHVHQGAEELGRVYSAELPIVSGMPEIASLLASLEAPASVAWDGSAEAAHAAYLEWRKPRPMLGDVQLGEIMRQLAETIPADSILTNGAGNYATWLHRHYSYRHFRSQCAPTSGAMGYGVPAAIAAKSLYPDRTVIAFAGDGCFMMSSNELATAMQYRLPVIFIVVNNAQYGTIRMHQERHYPNRVHGTELTNPDFAAYARAFGAHGELVESTEQFMPAFERARESGLPAVIEIRIPRDQSTPGATLEQIRQQGKR